MTNYCVTLTPSIVPHILFPWWHKIKDTINLILLIKKTHLLAKMEIDPSYDREEETHSDSPIDKGQQGEDTGHMAYHYMARNKVCKARIKSLKEKLKRASKR